MKEEKRRYHNDFYKFFKKEYPDIVKKMGIKWNPDRWTPRYDYFNERDCSGWRTFINTIPEPIKSNIDTVVFNWFTEPLDINSLMEKVQKTVNNYWNKIVICKTINTDEERKFSTMINGLKTLGMLNSIGVLRVCDHNVSISLDNIRAEEFTHDELPPEISDFKGKNVIGANVYPTKEGYWWELQNMNMGDNIGVIYFKPNEVKRVPEMKCTFQDGIFMAIPSELIDNNKLTEKFIKLIDNDNGDKPKGKVSKKKRPTRNQLNRMGFEELAQVIEDYDLDIDIDDFDDDDEDALQDAIIDVMGID